jgi:hypothetical protein
MNSIRNASSLDWFATRTPIADGRPDVLFPEHSPLKRKYSIAKGLVEMSRLRYGLGDCGLYLHEKQAADCTAQCICAEFCSINICGICLLTVLNPRMAGTALLHSLTTVQFPKLIIISMSEDCVATVSDQTYPNDVSYVRISLQAKAQVRMTKSFAVYLQGHNFANG